MTYFSGHVHFKTGPKQVRSKMEHLLTATSPLFGTIFSIVVCGLWYSVKRKKIQYIQKNIKISLILQQ